MGNRPLRLLMLVTLTGIGGAEMHVLRVAPGFDRRRVQPFLASVAPPGPFSDHAARDGLSVETLLMRSSWHFGSALDRLVRLIHQHAIDGIYAFGLTAAVLADAAARRTSLGFTIFGHRGAIRERAAKLSLKRWISNRASIAIYNSSTICAQATQQFGFRSDHAVVIRSGLDAKTLDPLTLPRLDWIQLCSRLGFNDPDAASADCIVATASNLRPEKDHTTFLHAARQVVDRRPHTRFLAIGDGPMLPQAIHLRKSLGLQRHVYFTGYRSDTAELVNASDVFVLTSRTESMPSAILEAMALGKPVVATEVGGVAELVREGQTGFLVRPGDPAQLATRLMDVMQTPQEQRERFGTLARSIVKNEFTLDEMIRQTENAVATAAQMRSPRPSYSESSTL